MRIVRRVLAVVATLFVLLIVTLWTASRFGVVQEMVRTRLLDILRTSLDAQIDLGGVGGTLGRSLVLRDFRVAVAGHNVVRAPRVEVVYALLPLVRGRLVVRRFTLVAPRVRLVSEHGVWRRPRPAERHGGSSRTALDVRTFEIRDGRIAVLQLDASTPRRFAATAVALTAGAAIDARHSEVTIRDLRFTPRGIAVTPVRASGTVARESGGAVHVVDLRLATARTRLDARADIVPGREVRGHVGLLLDAAELRAVVPASRLATNVDVRAEASGPWHAADFGVRADGGAAGRVHARALVDLDHRAYATRAELTAVDPAAAVPGLVRGPINGRLHARGRGVGLGDPVALLGRFHEPVIASIALVALLVATLNTNVAANVVSPSNDFSNLNPRLISFRTGGLITGVVGILMMPWKLLTDFNSYIFGWLVGYSGLLGPIAGIMIADYFVVRSRN